MGTYQPQKKGDNVSLNMDRIDHWISVGAQPSDTVASMVRKAKRNAPVAA
ncbi:MAG: 30S ribosomal protein S16 [Verrucomicrobiota bacterium]